VSEPLATIRCPLCEQIYHDRHHHHPGKRSELFQITVCPTCWEGNYDGWNPRLEPKLLEHAREIGLTIPGRLSNGLLPRG